MNDKELNDLVKQIEITIRTKELSYVEGTWNYRRFGFINAEYIRATIVKYQIGLVCSECLGNNKQRIAYCSKEHKKYYVQITQAFYFKPSPWKPWKSGDGDSIDHILPIANGGLEFDRDNLQYLDL